MQVLKLLEWDKEALDDSDLRRTSTKKDLRARGLRALARFLTGSWRSGILQHSCGLGCCTRGITETRQRLHDLVMDTLMTSLPPVPAMNRRTKLYPSLAWHAVTLNMHGMLKDIWGIVFGSDGSQTS